MYLVSLGDQGTHEIHPEIINVPGGIEYDRYFHEANTDTVERALRPLIGQN